MTVKAVIDELPVEEGASNQTVALPSDATTRRLVGSLGVPAQRNQDIDTCEAGQDTWSSLLRAAEQQRLLRLRRHLLIATAGAVGVALLVVVVVVVIVIAVVIVVVVVVVVAIVAGVALALRVGAGDGEAVLHAVPQAEHCNRAREAKGAVVARLRDDGEIERRRASIAACQAPKRHEKRGIANQSSHQE